MSGKIENLLKEAERETDSASREGSSEAFAERELSSESEAEKYFLEFRDKLFHIKKWNYESGVSSFELHDSDGNPQPEKKAEIGDFIKIKLPATGKYDWVKITEIHDAPDEVVITVRPSIDPTKEDSDEKIISHFFTEDATNNFCLQRKDKTLSCYVIGLHEKTNYENTENILETARNFATSNLGHYLGFQKMEWTIFCRNFLEVSKDENS